MYKLFYNNKTNKTNCLISKPKSLIYKLYLLSQKCSITQYLQAIQSKLIANSVNNVL